MTKQVIRDKPDGRDRPVEITPHQQAGAEGLAFEVCKPIGLSLNCQNDLRNHVDSIAERYDGILLGKRGSVAESYANCDFKISLDIAELVGLKKCKLFFAGVPFIDELEVRHTPDVGIAICSNGERLVPDSHDAECFVDLIIPNVVQGPEGFIPSFVWFECEEEFGELFGNLAVFAQNVFTRLLLCRPEGEFGVFRLGVPAEFDGGVVDRMIEAGPCAINNIENNGVQPFGDILIDAGFQNNFAGLRVILLDNLVGAAVGERVGYRFKAPVMVYRPANENFGIFERCCWHD